MATPVTRRRPDPAAALAQYRRRAACYDFELAPFEPVRLQAVAALHLQRGATVLDVGCGTGLSFPLLHGRIGAGGHIVGIDQSPAMLARARQRVREHGWGQVQLVCAPAAAARLAGGADAALFHLVHDVLRDDAALVNVLRHLKPGAQVVATGLHWAPPWLWPANAFVLLAALYSATSLEGLARPWDKLAARLDEVAVREVLGGAMFIASGSCRAGRRRVKP
ncbi:methyltransferase domain-containing protein [Ramlibacter sp. RBP-2]|uniref:Methyltransferase domain-containing protein n=1 Tax=Ramlibacter lithotrophicus TaxID=2606681 RepID=A0A7X6DED1_9BURK|nr:class I SAM-dependent methyltransferase [Ramlibacter lithotrophicus]NKE65625.1 methyltransferase domain-containing protein [Ramlibacter lithotrophicus]